MTQKPDGPRRVEAEALALARRLTQAADLVEGFIEDGDVPHGYMPRLALELARLAAAAEQALAALEAAAKAVPPKKPGGKAPPWQLRPRRPGA
jgi:hypothetical protein